MIGRYRILAKLGQGGLATVWKAHDQLLGRTVALKVLGEELGSSSKARRRFLHDAQAAAALEHPGIIAVYDVGEDGGLAYIALALIEGETVSERAAARLMPLEEAVRIARDAAVALAHAHEGGVIHRDVTGRNIMVARDGRVVVLDFGLALVEWESRVTTTGTAMGTVPYMAPEVIQARPADARSDLYGLGIVFYEALTGSFPFSAQEPHALFYSATNLEPVPPRERRPEIPEALERVVLKAIHRDPDQRYQTAVEFVSALDALDLSRPAPGANVPVRGPASDTLVRAGEGTPIYLAVLPFEGSTPDTDPEGMSVTLAARLAGTVSASLAGAPGIRVVPPPTTPPAGEPRDVARRLGASVLLRGSVHRSGSRMRVHYTILDPFRSVELAGDVVDGSAFDAFDLEDHVAASVGRALGLERSLPGLPTPRPSDPAAHERYLQALAYLRRHDNEASVDGAIALLERLVASAPQNATHHAALARAYLFKQKRTAQRVWESKAAAACERALALDGLAPEVQLAVGDIRLASGQHATALEAFAEAQRQRPDDFEAVLAGGRALLAAGRLPEARRACEEAIALQPADWRGHHWLGRVHLQSGEFALALEPCRKVIDLTPDNALGHRHLGTALYRLDRFGEAIAAYRESLAIQPNDEGYQNLGTALYFLGRHEEAIAALRKATELTPTSAIRWGNLGNACRWLPGHERETEMALERAIGLMRERLERDPTQADAWAMMAGWLVNRGRRDEAEAAIRRALDLGPRDVHCMIRAVHVFHHLGDRARCLHWFREALRSGIRPGEFLRSPDLAPLLSDPEFVRIVEEHSGRPAAQDRVVPGGGPSARMDAA